MYLRTVAALAVLVSAGVHLYLWFDVFRDEDIIGPLFLLNVVGGVVIAVLLVAWQHWIPAFLAVGFGASTLGAFITSSTVGLFGLHQNWVGWPVWTAAISEVVAIVAGGLLLLRDNPLRSRGQLQDGSTVGSPHLH